LSIGTVAPAAAAGGPCADVLSALPQPLHGQFTGNVTEGPDRGLSLSGTLTMYVAESGATAGTLAVKNGPTLIVSGTIAGYEIKLALATPDGSAIEGHGPLPQNCTGPIINGTLTGPQEKDRGDWGIIWGSGL